MIINAAVDLRSRFTPMPVGLHLGFCAFATVIFLLIFLRRKTVSSLIWALICDATVILELYHDQRTATAVMICEIALFAILAWVYFGERKEQKRLAAEAAKEADDGAQPEDELNDIAKLVKNERSKLANDEKNDVIGNAFEDDKL